jgi:hypothetical protein
MKIELNLDKWGVGFYSDFLAVDFTWGILFTALAIYFLNKTLKRNNIRLPFRKRG